MKSNDLAPIQLHDGRQRLLGHLGSEQGPVWSTSAIKKIKDDFILTTTEKLYRMRSRSEISETIECGSEASAFVDSESRLNRVDKLDDSGLLTVTASNNEPEVLQPVNVNTSQRKPTPKKDGVFKVLLPVENRPASRASSRSLSAEYQTRLRNYQRKHDECRQSKKELHEIASLMGSTDEGHSELRPLQTRSPRVTTFNRCQWNRGCRAVAALVKLRLTLEFSETTHLLRRKIRSL